MGNETIVIVELIAHFVNISKISRFTFIIDSKLNIWKLVPRVLFPTEDN